jgi:hypothetical protein
MKLARALRTGGAVLSLCLVGSLAWGCAGFSDEEATARCDQEEEARGGGTCFTAVTYDSCIQAYTDCGDDTVVVEESCPVTYSCPE